MKKITAALTLFLITIISYSQSTLRISDWQEYLNYRRPISVTVANGRVYCATEGGFFWTPLSENNIQHLSKINGLADIEATIVKYNSFNKKTLIIYKNTNMDIIEPTNNIVNIPDIKNKSLFGNKVINKVYLMEQYAYLACGFGIVVLDMNREEIKEVYNLDPTGSAFNIRDVTMDSDYIYAATDSGIYKASRTANLTNYTSWTKMTGMPEPNEIYNAIASVNGILYACLSKNLKSPNTSWNEDEIWQYDNVSWTKFAKLPFGFIGKTLRNKNNKLLITTQEVVYYYDNQTSNMQILSSIGGNGWLNCFDSDIDESGYVWVADKNYGLLKSKDFYNCEVFKAGGPISININALTVHNSELWAVAGGLTASNGNTFTFGGVSIYSKDEWEGVSGLQGTINLDSLYDMMNVIVDPADPTRAYAATFAHGLVEFKNRRPVVNYSLTNSPLGSAIPGDRNYVWTYGMAFDKDNNLWVTNSGGQESPLVVKLTNGKWAAPKLSPMIAKPYYAFQLIIDRNDQKWFTMPGSGVGVYKGGPYDVPNASNTRALGVAAGKGNLTSAGVYCLAEDLDGEIWVGTDKGICVFYSPQAIFSNDNVDAQTIKIEQDGNVQLLLETETVQAIAVDDANRKWLGTSSSGVYLMSEDGTKQIYHFDEKNSPLISNNIKSIAIDRKTGDVFFGTQKGIMSFRGSATKGLEEFTEVYAYPNPVRDNYTGPIIIKGLVANTIVKITDISGSIVRELNSEGGQAIWDAKNFKGEKVGTGVYMVFCTNQDGSQKIATKVVVIN